MKQFLKGKRVLITAGPTREYIDPVRYISNDSSGRMGYALAEAAKKDGARVVLVSGPVCIKKPKGIKVINVISAVEMYRAAQKEFKGSDIIFCAAAVADFRLKTISKRKIKKNYKPPKITLVKNPDILLELGKKKKRNQILIGFALETENLIKNATQKMLSKKCDFIIANSHRNIGDKKTSLTIIDRNKKISSLHNVQKKAAARKIVKHINGL